MPLSITPPDWEHVRRAMVEEFLANVRGPEDLPPSDHGIDGAIPLPPDTPTFEGNQGVTQGAAPLSIEDLVEVLATPRPKVKWFCCLDDGCPQFRARVAGIHDRGSC